MPTPKNHLHKLAMAACGLAAAAPASVWAQDCYLTTSQNMQIYWNGRVPPRVERPFNMTPAAGFFVGHAGFPAIATSNYQGTIYLMQWANRCVAIAGHPADACVGSNSFANPPFFSGYPGKPGAVFSSVARADACTSAQLTNALAGEDRAAAVKIAEAAGLTTAVDLKADQFATTRLAAGKDIKAALDICVLPAMPAGIKDRIAGVSIDYEVQDARSAAQSLAFLTGLANTIHGMRGRDGHPLEAVLWTNPSNWNPARNGVTPENAPAISRAFDYVTIMPTTKTTNDIKQDIQQQMQFWQLQPQKVFIMYDFAERFPIVRGLAGNRNRAGILAKMVGDAARLLKIDRIAIWGVARQDKFAACSPAGHEKVSCLLGETCKSQ